MMKLSEALILGSGMIRTDGPNIFLSKDKTSGCALGCICVAIGERPRYHESYALINKTWPWTNMEVPGGQGSAISGRNTIPEEIENRFLRAGHKVGPVIEWIKEMEAKYDQPLVEEAQECTLSSQS